AQVPDAALPGAGRLELARIGLDGLQQVVEVLVGRIVAHGQRGRVEVHQRQRREVARGQLGQALVMHHRNLHRGDADGVAIRRGTGDGLVAHRTIAAGAIDHVDRLAQVLLQQGADDAGRGIGTAAGAPGHDQRDRTFGPGGKGRGGGQDGAGRACGQDGLEQGSAGQLHGLLRCHLRSLRAMGCG
ncbi:conserved hypothetical protein, partial [Ricinus communis]